MPCRGRQCKAYRQEILFLALPLADHHRLVHKCPVRFKVMVRSSLSVKPCSQSQSALYRSSPAAVLMPAVSIAITAPRRTFLLVPIVIVGLMLSYLAPFESRFTTSPLFHPMRLARRCCLDSLRL